MEKQRPGSQRVYLVVDDSIPARPDLRIVVGRRKAAEYRRNQWNIVRVAVDVHEVIVALLKGQDVDLNLWGEKIIDAGDRSPRGAATAG